MQIIPTVQFLTPCMVPSPLGVVHVLRARSKLQQSITPKQGKKSIFSIFFFFFTFLSLFYFKYKGLYILVPIYNGSLISILDNCSVYLKIHLNSLACLWPSSHFHYQIKSVQNTHINAEIDTSIFQKRNWSQEKKEKETLYELELKMTSLKMSAVVSLQWRITSGIIFEIKTT